MIFLSGDPRPRRKPSLTPMIDVVFLLLVFFMLASRFGLDAVLPLPLASAGTAYSGPPRLIEVDRVGLRLNGRAIQTKDLSRALQALTTSPDDAIILRGREDAPLQRVVDVATVLRASGFSRLVLVE
ncbi:ExbD/TolR family protein [Sedimentitalea arenosa]|uniref:Biopolymer transporter ExbD n=1 Tax=Sedimentitalea arenosa TaxID=2798803 RepID=A0A8J7J528_9RHOB|nr:biopolymer transporter ExbD [Arenibacterium arenosum]MBJ6371780.1 biopolymer transporter ExbD [Arenibacterium arenosum]